MNLKYGEPVGYGSVDEMNREETIKDILFDALHRIYVAEKFGNGTRREGVRKCLDDAYKAGLLRAAEIADGSLTNSRPINEALGNSLISLRNKIAKEIRKEAK